ncbi:Homogentisate 1,2-dioxygenase [Fusarium oxysporum f. sp. albedinis]|nr:Homogentisate 1,2-dioxygenase [Fusarium oxysporum f. sp. albedinis]
MHQYQAVRAALAVQSRSTSVGEGVLLECNLRICTAGQGLQMQAKLWRRRPALGWALTRLELRKARVRVRRVPISYYGAQRHVRNVK